MKKIAKVKTAKEIAEEVKALRELKPKVRKFTAFGDNNHDAIDVQLLVLEQDMDEDEIYGHGWSTDQESNAMEALAWKNGEAEESLVDSWKPLAGA